MCHISGELKNNRTWHFCFFTHRKWPDEFKFRYHKYKYATCTHYIFWRFFLSVDRG